MAHVLKSAWRSANSFSTLMGWESTGVFEIFVNYRTVDARFGAAAAHHFLVGRFGAARVFLDHVSMTPGAVYPAELRAGLEQASVLVVLIGPDWLAREPDSETRRLVDREGDWVRREIRRALERDIAIIPVLLDGTRLPTPGSLPADISGLLMRQTVEIRHRSLGPDLKRLAESIVERVPELVLPDLFDEELALPSDPMPSELLRSGYRVVDFISSDDHLARLRSWLTAPAALEVRLVTGPGGCGKTRLAVELIEYARADGWQAGFVHRKADPDVIIRAATVRAPLLLVVDYAEGRSAQLETLIPVLLDRPAEWAPARVLLLARSPGQWQRALEGHRDHRIAALFTGVVPERVAEVPAGASRRDRFNEAEKAFRQRLASDVTASVAPPDDFDDDRYDRMLDVHAAALAAVLDELSTDPMPRRADPLRRVLDHEERYWRSSASNHGLPDRPERLRRLVAAATLVGADSPTAARSVLRALDLFDGPGVVADYRAWLAQMYPGPAALNPLRPDRLGEDLITATLSSDYPELTKDLAGVIDENQLVRALTVLARAARRHPVVRGAMIDLLSADTAGRIAVGMTVATQVDDPTLVDVLTELGGGEDLSAVIVDHLPGSSLALGAFAVVHTKALLRVESRRDPVDAGLVAELRHNLSLRLAGIGEYDQALVTAAQAVDEYRELAEVDPDDVVELAGALSTLANAYARLGLYADGEPAAAEAVELLGALAAERRPGLTVTDDEVREALSVALIAMADLKHDQGDADQAVEPIDQAVTMVRKLVEDAEDESACRERVVTLASALETLGVIHDTRGESRAALVATEEAVSIYRELDEAEPDRFRGDLIRVLGNLAGAHAELGLWSDGATLGEEAVALARSLVARHGDTHLVRLADTINNTAALLRRLDEHERALDYLNEAVPLYRGLADRLPGIHLAGLAAALHNLGNCLGEMSRPRDAVDAYEEAAEIYRKLSDPRPEVVEADLAEVLVGLADVRVALDDDEEALALATEAVELLDRAMRTDRRTTRLKLAHALHMTSATAFDLERFDVAARDARRAADLYRIIVEDNDRDLRTEHAAVLHGLARALDANGDHDRAAVAFVEAIQLHRALLAETDDDDIRDELAGVLLNAGVCASMRGDHALAIEHSKESVDIRRADPAGHPRSRLKLAEALNNLSDSHCDLENWEQAAEIADEAVMLATALHAEHQEDSTSLAVYALVTRARAAGPGNTDDTISALRRAMALADDGDLRALVRDWCDRLDIPFRAIKRSSRA
ncbi:MAG: tetratricopeptide repeat protein [Pseudonocardiaceae bacterium]